MREEIIDTKEEGYLMVWEDKRLHLNTEKELITFYEIYKKKKPRTYLVEKTYLVETKVIKKIIMDE